MDVSVIIVNFNTKKLTERAVRSVYKFTKGVNFEIIVVDNASKDGSADSISRKFPQAKLIRNKKNLGFGAANNQGMKVASGKYLFLLNSDAYLVENSLKKLMMSADDRVVAPLILNQDRSLQQSVGFLPDLPQIFFWMTFIDDLPLGFMLNPYHVDNDSFYEKNRQVGWVTGAAMLIPRAIFTKTKGFDENIFMYGEEVEWCKRITESGFHIILNSTTKLVHIGKGSQSTGPRSAIIDEYKNLIYYYKKHKGALALQILRLLLKIGALARIIIFTILGRKELAKIYADAFKAV